MNSVILINKPVGLRSSQCVGIARRKLGGLKVGHAGTLDSTASGLLVLLTGHAARLCEYVMSLPKVYIAEVQFGAQTDTCDYSGTITSEHSLDGLSVEAIDEALYVFSGWRMQKPPAVSAVKLGGIPAHVLARSGQEVETKARPVFFRNITRLSGLYDGLVKLKVSCGRGTYIRSMASDLGNMLGCGAYVKSLERVSSGNFRADNANSPDDEEYRTVSLHELAENYTRIYVSERDARSFTNGMSILLRHAGQTSRGLLGIKNTICVEGDNFLGFGEYAGYEYVRPVTVVPKD